MRGAVDVVLRSLAVAAAVVVALALVVPADDPLLTVLAVAAPLICAGALANRWWAAALVPGGYVLWSAGGVAVDPAFAAGADAPGWSYGLVLLLLAALVGACVALGVALRRAAGRRVGHHRAPSR